MRRQKGITLVALIITIIVLLILAVVTIRAVKGDGIINFAKNSRSAHENAQQNEQSRLDDYFTKMEWQLLGEKDAKGLTSTTFLKENTIVTDDEGEKFIVPEGYAVVRDASTGNKVLVDEGAVIQDASYNQWVWIPASVSEMSTVVDGKNVAKLYSFTATESKVETNVERRTEPGVLNSDGSDITEAHLNMVLEGTFKDTKTVTSFQSQLQSEFDKMLASVAKFGGYYIARYEMSGPAANPVVQKGKTVQNTAKLDWYKFYVSAKKLKANEGVTTGMIWGCQYDNVLRWLISTGDKTYAEIINAGDWGNFGTLTVTGNNDLWKAGNIYDLAGNITEFTMEKYTENSRLTRGYKAECVAAHHFGAYEPTAEYGNMGCRATMTIN